MTSCGRLQPQPYALQGGRPGVTGGSGTQPRRALFRPGAATSPAAAVPALLLACLSRSTPVGAPRILCCGPDHVIQCGLSLPQPGQSNLRNRHEGGRCRLRVSHHQGLACSRGTRRAPGDASQGCRAGCPGSCCGCFTEAEMAANIRKVKFARVGNCRVGARTNGEV